MPEHEPQDREPQEQEVPDHQRPECAPERSHLAAELEALELLEDRPAPAEEAERLGPEAGPSPTGRKATTDERKTP